LASPSEKRWKLPSGAKPLEIKTMEETERTYDWKSRWEDKCFEYLKESPEPFHTWWKDNFEEPEEPQEPMSAKEKLEQAEFVECEVVDATPMVLGYAH